MISAEKYLDENNNGKGVKSYENRKISTDVLIIGGGTAGCYAALTISENSDKRFLSVKKHTSKEAVVLPQV